MSNHGDMIPLKQTEIHAVADLLDEIENENLYRALLVVYKRTLQIVLLKMQVDSA